MSEKSELDVKMLIFSSETCIRCAVQKDNLKGSRIPYEVYDVNKPENRAILSQYGIEDEYDVPTFIVLLDGEEIQRFLYPVSLDKIAYFVTLALKERGESGN